VVAVDKTTYLENDMATMNLASDVDRLGILLAQISDLKKQSEQIKSNLREYGADVVEGALFRANIVEQERTSYDVEILRLAAAPEILALAKRETFSVAVRVTARSPD
jgi:hypothetical protein